MRAHERHGAQTAGPSAEGRRADASPGRLRALQRRVGNAAMLGLVSRDRDAETPGTLIERSVEGPGAPLPSAIRRAAGGSGVDTAGARVHQGPAVERAARRIDALAYTTSRPGTQPAIAVTQRVTRDPALLRRTLLEEAFHYGQQRRGPVEGSPFGDTMMSHPQDRHEREAQRWADDNA